MRANRRRTVRNGCCRSGSAASRSMHTKRRVPRRSTWRLSGTATLDRQAPLELALLRLIDVHHRGGTLIGFSEALGETGEIAPGGDQAVIIRCAKLGDLHGPVSSSAPARTTACALPLCRVSRL